MKNLTKALIVIAVLFGIQPIESKTDKKISINGLIANYPNGEYNITKKTAYLKDKDGNKINYKDIKTSQKSSRSNFLRRPKGAPKNAVKFAFYPTSSRRKTRHHEDTNMYLFGVRLEE